VRPRRSETPVGVPSSCAFEGWRRWCISRAAEHATQHHVNSCILYIVPSGETSINTSALVWHSARSSESTSSANNRSVIGLPVRPRIRPPIRLVLRRQKAVSCLDTNGKPYGSGRFESLDRHFCRLPFPVLGIDLHSRCRLCSLSMVSNCEPHGW